MRRRQNSRSQPVPSPLSPYRVVPLMRARVPLASAWSRMLTLDLRSHASIAAAQTRMAAVFRQEPHPLRHVQVVHYTTDHFEIYYTRRREQISSASGLRRKRLPADQRGLSTLSSKVPLIISRRTANSQAGEHRRAATEGVGAFAEPFRQRIVLPIDDPPEDRSTPDRPRTDAPSSSSNIIPQGLIPPQRARCG